MAGGDKRPAVKSRKLQTQMAKGARRRQRTGTGPRPEARTYGSRTVTRNAGQGISITVQIPPLRRIKSDGPSGQKAASARRRMLRPVLALPVLLLAGAFVLFGTTDPGGKTQDRPATPVAAEQRTEPAYEPLVPSAEKASATRYDGKRDLVSYTTTFSGVRVTVSQQPLPPAFAKDTKALQTAADNIQAKQRLETNDGPIYVAVPDDSGGQKAIYATKTVLLFIYTDRKMDDVSWKSFVELLSAKSWNELT